MSPFRPRRRSSVAALASLFAATTALGAQDPPAPELLSGPAAGMPLPACPVYAPSGPFAGSEFDAAARIGKGPGVLLFVHELTRNTGPMVGGLDRLAVQFAWTGLQTHTIRIAADRTEAEAAVKRSSDAMLLQRPILVSTDGVEGPGGYALNRKATLTLVLCKDGAVVRSLAFTDTGRADLPKLRALVEEVTGPVPADAAALRAAMAARLPRDPEQLRALAIELGLLLHGVDAAQATRQERQGARDARMQPAGEQRPGAAPAKPREGKAPDDEELRALLRRAIQKGADAAELDAVFAAVDARAGTDTGLRAQVADMWRLMLSLGYGNDDATANTFAGSVPPAGPPIDFAHDVLPLLQRHGCASAYCHGSATGQNGFKLSLFGSDPAADHAAIATWLRGRRLDRSEPERSLLVQK
ncbi:MAG: hypothetical protein WAT39_19720, partial [Planctomycetota bacterium]